MTKEKLIRIIASKVRGSYSERTFTYACGYIDYAREWDGINSDDAQDCKAVALWLLNEEAARQGKQQFDYMGLRPSKEDMKIARSAF